MNTLYTTRQGDRLDTIAWRAYGDPSLTQGILDANPGLPVAAQYPAGLRVLLPVLPSATMGSTAGLPPWKQETASQ